MHFSISTLWAILIFLVVLSAFFSLAEIAVMSVNRYRLRHLAQQKNLAAQRVSNFLERPERLLGAILLGDTFSDTLASAIATVLAVHFFGNSGVVIAAIAVTITVLIFGQMIPKTLGALYSQRIALTSALPLTILLKLLYPMVWVINGFSNGLLRLFGVKLAQNQLDHLTTEELRTLVYEAGSRIPAGHKNMLLRILELGKVTVEDVMVPRNEIIGINLDSDWDDIIKRLEHSANNRLPLYRDSINQVQGIIPLRTAVYWLMQGKLKDKETLVNLAEEPYFVPEATPLTTQLLNFRETKQRIGLVVNEYGDIIGLISIEDILQEIVGEFAAVANEEEEIQLQSDGSYLVDCSMSIRALNRKMHWKFSTDGPKTLSGLIIECLEFIPETNTCLRVSGYPIEIVEMRDNTIKTARILPDLYREKVDQGLS